MDINEYSAYVHFYTEDVPSWIPDLLARPGDSFLDIGCGDGALLYALKKQGHLEGKTVFAVDLSRSRIELVKKIDAKFNCIVSDASDLSEMTDNSIDIVCSSQVIEHIQNEAGMLREIRRVLKENGRVYLSTVFKKWYGWYFYRCNGKWVLDPTHIREYTHESQLLPLITEAGLTVVSARKSLFRFPIIDFILRKLGLGQTAFQNPVLARLRNLTRLPIPGYYNWELLLEKRRS